MLIFGNVPVELTITWEVFVHPLVALVAVTVYVPAEETVAGFVAFVNAPPFQTIVFPALVPVNVALVVVHVIFPELVDVTVGGVVLEVTLTVCCEAQPVPISVTVNVYVPAVLTVYVAVAGPLVH